MSTLTAGRSRGKTTPASSGGSFRAEENTSPESHLPAVPEAAREAFPWADDAALQRILTDTVRSTHAAPKPGWEDDLDRYDDDDAPSLPCLHCGGELVSNLDGTRGRWGHSSTADTTCESAERSASLALRLRESADGYKTTNPVEHDRLNTLALEHEQRANSLAKISGAWSEFQHHTPEATLPVTVLDSRPAVELHRTAEGMVEVFDSGVSPNRVRFHFCDDTLHNPRGPAVEYENGDVEYWVRGMEVTPPEEGYRLVGVTPSNVLEWQTGDNYRVDVHPGGEQFWTYDGDLHRDGAPAVLNADGSVAHWYRRGTIQPSPIPEAPHIIDTMPADRTRGQRTTIGSKYVPDTPMKAVANKVKQHLEYMQEMKYLPGSIERVSFEVTRSETRRGGRALGITVHGLTDREVWGPEDGAFYAPETSELNRKLRNLVAAYNRVTIEKGADGIAADFDTTIRFDTGRF